MHISFFWLTGLTSIYPSSPTPEFWTTGIPLSLGPNLTDEPAICAQGDNIFVAWSDNRLGTWEVFFRYSLDGGATWQREERVTRSGSDSVQPAIACSLSNVHFVWLESNLSETQCRYKSWNGNRWSPVRTLSRTGASVRRPKIGTAASGNWTTVVWDSQTAHLDSSGKLPRNTRTTAIITHSGDGGRTWIQPQPIAPGDWDTREPDIAGGLQSVYVTWVDNRDNKPEIFVKRWNGSIAGNDARVSSIGICRKPSIALLEPHIHVAWESKLSEIAPATVFSAESTDAGQTWGSVQKVSTETYESVAPQILVRRDDEWIVWQDAGESVNWKIRAACHSGHGWTVAEIFSDDQGVSTLAAIAKSGSIPEEQIHIVWVNRPSPAMSNTEGNTSRIIYRRRDTIPPTIPAQPIHIDADARTGFDNDSQLTFSWQSLEQSNFPYADGQQYHVFVSIDDGDFTEIGSTNQNIVEVGSEDNKRYRVAIQTFDSVGNRSELSEPSLPVFVDRHPPNVQIHLPATDTVVTRPIPVIASCVDSNLVECHVRFGKTTSPQAWTRLIQPIRIQFERERIAVWDTSNLNGIYTLALTAVDQAGNLTAKTVRLNIDNKPPLPLASSNGAVRLTDFNAAFFFRTPVWSPDGQKIAFSSNEGGAVDIWLLNLRDRSRHRLMRDMAVDLNPAWHPNSERLVFQSRHPSQIGAGVTETNTGSREKWEIWTIQSDGSDHRMLFQFDDINMNPQPTMTGNVASHTHIAEGLVTPAWSPTGEQIAFAADVDGDFEIWAARNASAVLSGARAQVVQLTSNKIHDIYPDWAPDASQIAFQSERNGNWEVGLIEIDGTGEMVLHQSPANETRPVWSPDSKSILFLSDQGEDLQSPFVLNLTERRITQISPIASGRQPIDLPQIVNSADWSPDGKAIVYQSNDMIYFMPLEFPGPTIEARFEQPVNGAHVHGKVNLLGIARGEMFQEYRLEYASISAVNQWNRIGGKSTVPVTPAPFNLNDSSLITGGFLGQWDVRKLSGVYVLRLVAVTNTGDEIEDRVNVYVENERPRLEILHPSEALHTTDRLITVRGRAEKQSTVSIDNAIVRVDEDGSFETQLFLKEAENRIAIRAVNPFGLETSVFRNVYLKEGPPELIVDSPEDFAILDVPYVTVSGQVNTAEVQLKINDVVIPMQSNRRFSRTLPLQPKNPGPIGSEDILIRVEVFDRLGNRNEVQRRVIYQPNVEVRKDVNPPGITDIFPPGGTVVQQADPQITAILIDDVEIVQSTIHFSFDEDEYVFDKTEGAAIFDGDIFDFNPVTGQFTYAPPNELVDGRHTFKWNVQDIEGNLAESAEIEFIIDTLPFYAAISAERTGDLLKVFVDTNKRLNVIPSARILPSGSPLGYTLNLHSSNNNTLHSEPDVATDLLSFRYEDQFRMAPSQTGFTLSAVVRLPRFGQEFQLNGGQLSLVGYFSDRNRYPEIPPASFPQSIAERASRLDVSHLFVEGGPRVVLIDPNLDPDFKVTLRSQSGLDQNRVLAQNQNAIERRLTILQPVYMIEANVQKQDTLLWITLPIPQPGSVLDFARMSPRFQGVQSNGKEASANVKHMVLYWWDSREETWMPLDTDHNQYTALGAIGQQFGSYALLTEKDPPIIRSIRPGDGEEVPLNRFFIEAEITDVGSGVDSIQLQVNGLPVQFHYEPDTGRLTYVPSDLKSGKHTLELSAADRANNSVYHHQNFFTREIFDFVGEVSVYPNPAAHLVKFQFNLTKTADVALKIYDTAGQLVHMANWGAVTGNSPAYGIDKFIWNCENQEGETVASGVYIYILEAASRKQTVSRSGKIAVVR